MWTSEDMVVTTTSITAVNGSMRSAHSECMSPEVMNEKIVMRASSPSNPTTKNAYHDSTQAMTRNVDVMSPAASEPAAAGSCSGSSACVCENAPCCVCGAGAPCGGAA